MSRVLPPPGVVTVTVCHVFCHHQVSSSEQDRRIYTTGCVDAGEEWLNSNLVPVAGCLIGVGIVQVRVLKMWRNIKYKYSKYKYSKYKYRFFVLC